MSPQPITQRCEKAELACTFVLDALSVSETREIQAHIAGCPACRQEIASLRPVVERFASWPTDLLRPPASLQTQLALRIADHTGAAPALPPARHWSEPEWEEVAPGIACKLLARDTERQRISMLVRLAPGARYPAHRHAGPEELHLLAGELWIDDRKLMPGDYSYGAPGDADDHVWSESGCTCLLVTSTKDALR